MTHDDQDRQVALDDPAVPQSVRNAVRSVAQPGDTLWRCPWASAPRGVLGIIGIGHREPVTEWWLLSPDGDLIEAFWEE